MHRIINHYKNIKHIAEDPVFTVIDNFITFEMGKEYWVLKYVLSTDTGPEIFVIYNENNKVICCYVYDHDWLFKERVYIPDDIFDNISNVSPYRYSSIVDTLIMRWIGRNLHVHFETERIIRGRIVAGDGIEKILKNDKLKSETICEDYCTKQNQDGKYNILKD